MSNLIEMLKDVYPFGVKGDVVTLAEDELAKLEAAAKKLEGEVFKVLKPAVDAVEAKAAPAAPSKAEETKPATDTTKVETPKVEDKPAATAPADTKAAK